MAVYNGIIPCENSFQGRFSECFRSEMKLTINYLSIRFDEFIVLLATLKCARNISCYEHRCCVANNV